MNRMDELVEKAVQLLNAKAAAHSMVADLNRRLEELRDEMVEAGACAEDTWDVTDGELKLEPGRVTVRRGVRTDWLDDHFEDLPADVRGLCDITETVAIPDMAKAPSVVYAAIREQMRIFGEDWLKFDTKLKWPRVSDLEKRLPPEIAAQAITEQKRDKPVLVFEQRGISVGQNDRA